MAIATRTQFWTSRLNGEDPTNPTVANSQNNTAWTATGSGASASGGYWSVTDARYHIVPTTDAYTMLATFQYTTAPDNDEVLMKLDNGTKKVEVKAFGQKVKLVGATTATSDDLDISMATDSAVPIMLRLTLDASGNARLYMREIIEDDDGATHYLSVAGASGSSRRMEWGNNTGSVQWASL